MKRAQRRRRESNIFMKLRSRPTLFSIAISVFFILALAFFYSSGRTASVEEVRKQLQKELADLEKQIQGQLRSEALSFQRELKLLDQETKKIKLELLYRDLSVRKLTSQIKDRSGKITDLESRIAELHDILEGYIKTLYTDGSESVLVTILRNDQFSDFFSQIYAIENIQGKLQVAVKDIRETKVAYEEEKVGLEEERNEEEELRAIQETQRRNLASKEKEKQNLLKATQGKESEFKKLVAKNKQTAATIRSRLFILEGSPAISFGKALEYALAASQVTGVRPAFLLGTLRYESELGANVGKGNWKQDLSHSRCASQREAFQKITTELGLNPDLMPVSRRQSYGYCGGAMGPAQFIPTTWLLYKDKEATLSGQNPPSPWDPGTAFIAAALLMKDNGAAGSLESERRAALKYFAGSRWSNPAYRFYGDNVMKFAQEYQEQIDILNAVALR